MIDIELIRNNSEELKRGIAKKKANPELVDEAQRLDKQKRSIQVEFEAFQSRLNIISKEISKEYGQKKLDLVTEASQISAEVDKFKPRLEEVSKDLDEVMRKIPNPPSEDTPEGKDESDNKVVRQHGKKPEFDFDPREHWQLGEKLGVIDTETATRVSGTRFAYLKGPLAMMQFALIQMVLSIVTSEDELKKIIKSAGLLVNAKPFIPIIPPVFIRPEVMERMARLEPKDERYHMDADDLYLVGSAEHTLGPIHMDQTLDEKQLPLRYAGYSTAFRREAGSYGKDMKGILRVHQFDKLELESFTTSETSFAEQDFIVAIQEHIVQKLEIPYQVVQICTGDMGDPDARQVDIEMWMPGQNKYRETHTSDCMTDFQSRRLRTKVKRTDGKVELVHMNDATAVAIGRTLIAIMENYQQKDGSIKVPKVLVPYCGFDVIK
jgi:seryl-tRNA synthetase